MRSFANLQKVKSLKWLDLLGSFGFWDATATPRACPPRQARRLRESIARNRNLIQPYVRRDGKAGSSSTDQIELGCLHACLGIEQAGRAPDDLELPLPGHGNVHVHAAVAGAGDHLGRPARTMLGPRLIECDSDIVARDAARLLDRRLPQPVTAIHLGGRLGEHGM